MNSKSCIFVLLLLVGAEVARAQSGGSNDEFLSASSINSGSGSSSGSSSGYGDQCYCYSLKDYLNSEYYDQAKLVLRVDIVSTRDISPKGYDYQRKVYIAKVSHIWQSDYYKQQYGGSNSEYPSIECGTTVAIIIKPSGDCTKIPPFEVYKSYIITAYSDLHYDYEYPTIYYNPCYDAWSLFCTAWGDSEIVSKLQAWDSTRCQPCQPYSTYYSSSYLSGGNSGSSSSGSDEYASSSSSSTTYACAYCNDTYKQFKSYDDAYCAGYYVATGDYAKCPNYNTVKYSDSDYDQQEYYPQNEQSYNDYYTAAEDDYKEY